MDDGRQHAGVGQECRRSVAGNAFAGGRDVEGFALRAKPQLPVVGEIGDQAERFGLVDGEGLAIGGDEKVHGAHQTPHRIARGWASLAKVAWATRYRLYAESGKFAATRCTLSRK